MLQIKTGLVIHADYEFTALSASGAVKGTYGFINNELLPKGVEAFAKAKVFQNAEFGISGVEVAPVEVEGAVMPVLKVPFASQKAQNSHAPVNGENQVVFTTVYDFVASGFKVTEGNDLNIREFGIEGLSRVVLKDPYQNIPDGIELLPGDSIRVKVTFNFTYYTNNKTSTLGEDAFGTKVDYVSEVVILPDVYPMAVRIANGFGTAGSISILPITTDIRNKSVSQIKLPVRDEYQQAGVKVDDEEHRIDMAVIGFRKQRTDIYGFLLRDEIRGVGVLVRFLKPVTIERDKRYEVGGYIKWGPVFESMDDGYTTVPIDTLLTQIQLGAEIASYNISRPVITPDAVSQLTSLNGLRFDIDDEVVFIPASTPMPRVVEILSEYGLDVTLLSNRPAGQNVSTFDFYRPEKQAHEVLVSIAKQTLTQGREDWLFPVLVVGGDYIDTTPGVNSWRWDCYFPYMGQSQRYIGYTFGGFQKAADDLSVVATYVDGTVIEENERENNTTGAGVTTTKDAEELLNISIETSRGKAYAKISHIDGSVDPSLVTRGYRTIYNNDFDTSEFVEWLPGRTEITLNYRFLDLTTNAVSDTARNVTEFRIVYDSNVHNPLHTDLWINGQKLGPVTRVPIATFEDEYGLRVNKTVADTKTTYIFTRPYTTENTDSIDLFFLGNESIAFDDNETGYIKILNGNQGFRVYDKTGSEITDSLYHEDNAFLLAGVRLYQPLPEYMYKYRVFTVQEAAMYFGDASITNTLAANLFSIKFDNGTYSIGYQNSIDSKDPNLAGHYLYPAIGIDLTKIDDIIDDSVVLFRDPDGKSWTKGELLGTRITQPERIVDNTYYFITPVRIQEGSTRINRRIESSFYDQHIEMDINIEAIVTYTLVSAEISPNPATILVGESIGLTYAFQPPLATITNAAWATLDPMIATVSQNGTVTGVTAGATTVRLTLNNNIIATGRVNVLDPNIVISCDGSPNITDCLTISGEAFGLQINDQDISTSIGDEAIRNYFRDNDSFRIVNCTQFTKPQSTTLSETGFMELDGEYDLFVNGTLVGRDLNVQEIIDELNADERIVVIKGDSE